MRLLAFFTAMMASNAFASIPTHINRESFTANQDIRVSLGSFRRLELRVQDLQSNGHSLGAGVQEFAIQCNGAPQTPIEVSGIGRTTSPLNLDSPTGFLRLNGKNYRGKFTIYAELDSCLVVNSLSMDYYLAGLLNKEMSPSWPLEALKAQAVASRTYAIFQKNQNKNLFYDLESTTLDQVYEGSDAETPRSHQAVQETAALILSYKSQAIKAFYHADCGGKTEAPNEVWGTRYGYLRPVVCPFHTHSKSKTNWTYSIGREQLERAFKKIAGLLPSHFLRIASVQAGPINNNMRLESVFVSDGNGKRVKVAANTFRNALGNTRVKSTSFNLKYQGDGELTLSGKGFGHGVGLCQIGAREMAHQGRNYRQILQFYYPLAKLEPLH